jgi:hypothetical protein
MACSGGEEHHPEVKNSRPRLWRGDFFSPLPLWERKKLKIPPEAGERGKSILPLIHHPSITIGFLSFVICHSSFSSVSSVGKPTLIP